MGDPSDSEAAIGDHWGLFRPFWALLGVSYRWGPRKAHKNKELTFWCQGPIQGRYQKSWFLVALYSFGLLGPNRESPRETCESEGPVAGINAVLELPIDQSFLT